MTWVTDCFKCLKTTHGQLKIYIFLSLFFFQTPGSFKSLLLHKVFPETPFLHYYIESYKIGDGTGFIYLFIYLFI